MSPPAVTVVLRMRAVGCAGHPTPQIEAWIVAWGAALVNLGLIARIRLEGGERLTVTRPRRVGGPPLRPGARVALRWSPEDVRVLPPEA